MPSNDPNSPHYSPLRREPLLQETLPAGHPPVTLIKGARIRFAPGQPTGPHRHPISTMGVVTEGSFIFQLEGQEARLLRKGDSFFEPAGQVVAKFDNASSSEAAEIVSFYLSDSDQRPLIEMLDGGIDSENR